MSEKSKEKLSESKKGKPAPNRGKPMSEEHKKNLSEAKKGHTVSPGTIAKREATKRAKREADYTYGKPKKGEDKQEAS